MATTSFAVRLEVPWNEPIGLAEPTDRQWSDGIVVVMTVTMSGNATHKEGEMYLMDVPQAERLITAGYARRETEREITIAKSMGHRRGPNLTGHPAVEGDAKPKAKAKSKPKAKAKSKPKAKADGG